MVIPIYNLHPTLPGTTVTVWRGNGGTDTGNTQTLDAEGFDGETMGGIILTGAVRTNGSIGGGDGNALYVLAPNDLAANQSTTGDIATSFGLAIFSNAPNTDTDFTFTVTCNSTKTGAARVFTITTTNHAGTVLHTTGTWNDTTTPLRCLRFKAIGAGSGGEQRTNTIQPVLVSGLQTSLSWVAQGL